MRQEIEKNLLNEPLQVVWIEKLQPNIELLFRCRIPKCPDAKLIWIAKDVFNVYINQEFVCYGPARSAKGYARVEEMDLLPYLNEGENIIDIYVQSNDTNLFSHAVEEPFFGASIASGDRIIRTTDDFACYRMNDRIQKVERMSRQRGFLEVYEMKKDRSLLDEEALCRMETITRPRPKLLDRHVAYADNEVCRASFFREFGVQKDASITWENDLIRLLKNGDRLSAYPQEACDCILTQELLQFVYTDCEDVSENGMKSLLYGLPRVRCGKIRIHLKVFTTSSLWLVYDDLLVDGAVSFRREQIIHGMKWMLEPGEYTLYTQEVYTAKYLQLTMEGKMQVEEVAMICIENPLRNLRELPQMEDWQKKIVEAAIHTFAQNAYDIFTDCPSRERAGWLCDSYFIAQAEDFLLGEHRVERNFLENYLHYESDVFSHPGILPMCYPSEVSEDGFIPNWILWYVLQLESYLKRSKDVEFIALHRKRIYDILDYFASCENEFGLLEHLNGWVFVEWSAASDYVDGVNFPTNMLYAEALRAAGTLLSEERLIHRSDELKKRIRELSFDGEVYIDNAIRVDGTLKRTENVSELCQIFALFFEIEPQGTSFFEHFKQRFIMLPSKRTVAPAALFIGEILRLMVLYRYGEYELLLSECRERFLPMAERTGTIWELFREDSSCNHGFGSVLAKLICESVERVNAEERVVQ